MKRIKTLLLSLLPCAVHAQADTIAASIDRYVASAHAAGKFNGVALVARNGKVIFHKAFGWKDYAARAVNDTATVFPVLSITKCFTAMVMLKLQEQQKLSLADKVGKYLPDFPHGNKITIEQLLTHTSGIYNYTDDIGEEDSALVNHPVPYQRVLDIFYGKPLSHEPGQDVTYNNSGYYLAGLVIEKATGKSYWQNVREWIFSPLDMSQSGFDFNGLPANRKATGYQFLDPSRQKAYPYLDSTVSYAAGSIYSTSADLYKWVKAIGDKKILSPQSWSEALSRKAGDYGIGFRVNRFLNREYIKHSGGYPGFVSEFIYFPEQAVTIILLKNTGNYGQDLWPVTMGISSIVFGAPYDLWKRRSEIKLAGSVLARRKGKYRSDQLEIDFVAIDNQLHMRFANGMELPLLGKRGCFLPRKFQYGSAVRKKRHGGPSRTWERPGVAASGLISR